MSSRSDSYKGSSRSTRDDSRLPKESRKEYERRRSRSRSRSPRRRDLPPTSKHSPTRSGKHSPTRSSKYSEPNKPPNQERDRRRHEDKSHKISPVEIDSSEEEAPAPPPPPRITPISIELAKSKGPIKMNLAGPAKSVAKKPLVASVFNNDDDEEVEEMPAEARMRMRNIGRETPTSAGPNSFGKTKQGFCDAKKVFEKNLKQALEPTEKPAALAKFPQTIYKIKGP